jgi:hypothetical protein
MMAAAAAAAAVPFFENLPHFLVPSVGRTHFWQQKFMPSSK